MFFPRKIFHAARIRLCLSLRAPRRCQLRLACHLPLFTPGHEAEVRADAQDADKRACRSVSVPSSVAASAERLRQVRASVRACAGDAEMPRRSSMVLRAACDYVRPPPHAAFVKEERD